MSAHGAQPRDLAGYTVAVVCGIFMTVWRPGGVWVCPGVGVPAATRVLISVFLESLRWGKVLVPPMFKSRDCQQLSRKQPDRQCPVPGI